MGKTEEPNLVNRLDGEAVQSCIWLLWLPQLGMCGAMLCPEEAVFFTAVFNGTCLLWQKFSRIIFSIDDPVC